MQVDIIIVEGLHNRSRDRRYSILQNYFVDIVKEIPDIGDWTHLIASSSQSVKQLDYFIENQYYHSDIHEKGLFIVCNSIGVVEVYNHLNKEDLWKLYKKIGIVTIDGRSKFLSGPAYGKRNPFEIGTLWPNDKILIHNIHQRLERPYGARFNGADVQIMVDDTTNHGIAHHEIIRHPEVRLAVDTMATWIKNPTF